MSKQRDLLESMSWHIIGCFEFGQTEWSVTDAVRVVKSVIERLRNRLQETGNFRYHSWLGEQRATTATEDRVYTVYSSLKQSRHSTQLQRQLLLATGLRVSNQTVRNKLHQRGLYALRTMVCIPLISNHSAARRRLAAEHRY